MTRHAIDHRAPSDGSRTRAFVALERKSGSAPHPATTALLRRSQASASSGKSLEHFLRIARGHSA